MENLSLREDGCCCLCGWNIGAISNPPNIAIFVMPHCIFVAVKESSAIGKARLSYVLMSSHRRNHMQKIELLNDDFLRL